jgi:Flp pilus assembly protein TadB
VSSVLAALLAGGAALWMVPCVARPVGGHDVAAPPDDTASAARLRFLWAAVAGLGAALFVSGRAGLPSGLAVAVATWVVLGRTEPPDVRRAREAAERDLPGLVHLMAAALESGCATSEAIRFVCDAYPGPAADRVAAVSPRLALGVDVESAWQPVLQDAELAVLGRTMVRAHRSGASVATEIAGLADELGRRARVRVEERARSVGVKAAVPLGLCLLPSFLLLGIVPLAVSLLQSLSW